MLMFTVLPLLSQIQSEEQVLSVRRSVAADLHNELQHHLAAETTMEDIQYEKHISHAVVSYHFSVTEEKVKGCAGWNNVKNRKETFCLYGLL